MDTNKLFLKNIIKYGVLFATCGTFIMTMAIKDAYSHEQLAKKYDEERIIPYELFEKPSEIVESGQKSLRWRKDSDKTLRFAEMDVIPARTDNIQFAALSSDLKSKIPMEEITDKELDDIQGTGLSLKFHNTDLKNQEALNYFGEMLEGLESTLGFDPFGLDWSAHIYGATYNEGVSPVEFNLDEMAVVLNMPNHIDKIQLFTPIENLGDIYFTNITCDCTIRIQFDLDQLNERTGFRR